jgi:hypothetical protein
MSLDDALSMIRRRRPQAEPIPSFMDFLRSQEEKLKNYDRAANLKTKRERTASDTNDDETAKRKAQRVIGPDIAPAHPPNNNEVKNNEKRKSAAAVGPVLPPRYMQADEEDA